MQRLEVSGAVDPYMCR